MVLWGNTDLVTDPEAVLVIAKENAPVHVT